MYMPSGKTASSRLRLVAGNLFPFLKMPPPVDRQTAGRLRPIRNCLVEWQISDQGEGVLQAPRRKDRVGRLVGAWFRLPDTRTVILDEVGAFVWQLCDGEHTVESIVQKLLAHYKLGRRETEVSVAAYLQSLTERRLIGLYERQGRKK